MLFLEIMVYINIIVITMLHPAMLLLKMVTLAGFQLKKMKMKEKMEFICVKSRHQHNRQLIHVYPDQASVCRIQMLLLIKITSIRKAWRYQSGN